MFSRHGRWKDRKFAINSILSVLRNSNYLESGHRKLKADGFELVFVTDGSFEDNRISKLNRQILSTIAEYQREEIVF